MAEAKDLLGFTGIDTITGFTGVIVGACYYVSGCTQLLLSPRINGESAGKEPSWFDLQRVKIDINHDQIVLDNGKTPGCDKPAPKR